MATLNDRGTGARPLRVGALSTLSRNFQLQFLRPLLSDPTQDIVLKSGGSDALLDGLETMALDVVLTTEVPKARTALPFAAQRIDEQPLACTAIPHACRIRRLRRFWRGSR